MSSSLIQGKQGREITERLNSSVFLRSLGGGQHLGILWPGGIQDRGLSIVWDWVMDIMRNRGGFEMSDKFLAVIDL